jgi:hypothetical protein
MKERVLQLLNQQDSSLAVIKNILREYSSGIAGETEREKHLKQTVGAILGML